ncbi:hypothetical protein DFH07DRAFT_835370 [Mycena maculata]|uniref:Protein kinase domain-containing protein n=1 Tax=Mycena maculata TaxID=230809 RepID=A0AAD7N2V6_9AGAR|nr:hypothetical protein DFH07DRAFT_835370 [Mycena maculata]
MENSSLTVSEPFRSGSRLQLLFKPEAEADGTDPFLLKESEAANDRSPGWQKGFAPLTVSVIRAHTPFTCAVVLEVEIVHSSPKMSLPDRFILKLNDRRFGYRHSFVRKPSEWNSDREAPFVDAVRMCLDPRRSTAIPHYFDDFPGPHEAVEWRTLDRQPWMAELYTWKLKYQQYLAEILAYRCLQTLQGASIPRLHGTVRLPILCGSDFLHPAVDFVNGFAVSLIEGTPMNEVQVGRDLTKARAEEVSQRVLDLVRTIQRHRCLHNDIRLPNIILRNWPRQVDPVLIDFGAADIEQPHEPVMVYPGCGSDEVRETRSMLADPEYGGWHAPSPFSQRVNEKHAAYMGFFRVNDRIESVPEHIRDLQYERIPDTDGPDAKKKVLQWRVREGVKTRET